MTSTTEHLAELAFALVGLTAFAILLIARLRMSREYESAHRPRLLLVDLLLFVVGVELVADAVHGLEPGQPLDSVALAIAFVTRGALVAGGIVLAATVDWVRD